MNANEREWERTLRFIRVHLRSFPAKCFYVAVAVAALAWVMLGQKPLTSDIPAARTIADPYPVFNGIAVDGDNNLVGMPEGNRTSLLIYVRTVTLSGPTEHPIPLR